jgi:hypothetical protein
VSARAAVACLLAALLAVSCRIHVTIWLAGHPVARPPVAGLLLAATGVACLVLLVLIVRACWGFRSSPYPRPA